MFPEYFISPAFLSRW